jgi:hypothetical protein
LHSGNPSMKRPFAALFHHTGARKRKNPRVLPP